ncbi:MAG TPA: hypothetical protein VES38_00470 [Methylotenera sp.]|nr:hypothetical protein [Methylotenera sp.]
MVSMNQVAVGNEKASSKWLLWVLLVVVVLTVWTAFNNEGADDNNAAELLSNKSLTSNSSLMNTTQQSRKPYSKQAASLNNTDSGISWQNLKREPIQEKVTDLFKVHSWLVIPPVKKVKPVPPPPPVAPPAPFTYIGKLEDAVKGTQIFLLANNKFYSVILGANIDQQWRLDSDDANNLHLTYLPLNLPQILSKSARAASINTVEMNQ